MVPNVAYEWHPLNAAAITMPAPKMNVNKNKQRIPHYDRFTIDISRKWKAIGRRLVRMHGEPTADGNIMLYITGAEWGTQQP